MTLFEFHTRFPNEQSCEEYLKAEREKEGLICSKCNQGNFYWLKPLKLWKCANCGTWLNLRAGTLMEKSKVPLLTWFRIIHLMTSTKKAFSALEMQKQVGHKFYEPIWYCMQKIRISMGKRDAKYRLQGDIEIDDAFFEVVDEGTDKTKPIIQGRGSRRQAYVLVIVESRPNPKQDNPNKKKRIMGFAKMIVMDNLTKKTINYEVQKGISPTSIVITDKCTSYADLKELVKEHTAMVIPKKETLEHLPWVHTVIANAKRQLLGVHHSIHREYLQNYLNEFTYKLNRRTFSDDLFNRMIVAGAHDTWY